MHTTLFLSLALLAQPLLILAEPIPRPNPFSRLNQLRIPECYASETAPPVPGLKSIIETVKEHSTEDCDFIPWPGKDGDGTKNRCGFTISKDGVKVMICGTSTVPVRMKCESIWKDHLRLLLNICTRQNNAGIDVAGGRTAPPASKKARIYAVKDE
ncbi:uncharacterized protein LAJ45_09882 [Morchella importuna]|uniref:uncharacterized protein n=1 Tax=Morchella importuna TaxID=1174673 RepID=UPI001E8CABF2|nr:uncharacterized protein LAJ45_09882 [Morchella importuna]KAH8146184.1 hypothetical protein LAJ45_09882 [Morchella importuna]